MSTLVLLLAPRERLRAQASAAGEGARASREFSYALSADGLAVSAQGRCAAALLPKADSVIAVLADADVSWHRITLPKAPAARLRAAAGRHLAQHPQNKIIRSVRHAQRPSVPPAYHKTAPRACDRLTCPFAFRMDRRKASERSLVPTPHPPRSIRP